MVDENAVVKTRTRIKGELRQLACKLQRGEDDELLVWVIPGVFACAHRPLRYHPEFGGRGQQLPPEAASEVLRWVDRIVNEGIRSIICLLHPNEIRHYALLDLGAPDILAFYRRRGLLVCHLPWDDPAHPPPGRWTSFQDEVRRACGEGLACFDRLPKPILIHCSAGQDRSAPVAAYIHEMRRTAL